MVLYQVDSPITRQQRNNLNDTFRDILSRFNALNVKFSLIVPGDADALIQRIETAVQNAEINTAQALQQLADALTQAQAATTEAQQARDNAVIEINRIQQFLISSVHTGEYNASTQYVTNNEVLFNGSTYAARRDNIGIQPPALPIPNNEDWQLIARRGVDGDGGDTAALEQRITGVRDDLTTTQSSLNTHIANDDLAKHKATQISIVNPSNQTTESLQIFGDALFTSVSNAKQNIRTAITDKDPSVVIPDNPTFPNLVTAIGEISTGGNVAVLELTKEPGSRVFTNSTGGNVSGLSYITIDTSVLGFQPTAISVINSLNSSNGTFSITYWRSENIISFSNTRSNAVFSVLNSTINSFRIEIENNILYLPVTNSNTITNFICTITG